MIYWDTSALLKLYVEGPDSAQFDALAGEEDSLISSTIVTAEILCVLYRKEQAGDLKRGGAGAVFRQFTRDVDTGRIVTIPYGRDVVAQVEKLVKHTLSRPRPLMIRSLDAIHVGSALAGKARMLVATDNRLRNVASAVHLKVAP